MTDHTIDYSGLTPRERNAYVAALGTAELAMEWLQQPLINEAFRAWVTRTYPEVIATTGRQLEPAALDLMADLFAMQILLLLPDGQGKPGISATGITSITQAAVRAFEKQAAKLASRDTGTPAKPAPRGNPASTASAVISKPACTVNSAGAGSVTTTDQ